MITIYTDGSKRKEGDVRAQGSCRRRLDRRAVHPADGGGHPAAGAGGTRERGLCEGEGSSRVPEGDLGGRLRDDSILPHAGTTPAFPLSPVCRQCGVRRADGLGADVGRWQGARPAPQQLSCSVS